MYIGWLAIHPEGTAVDPGERGDDRPATLCADVEDVAVVEDAQQNLVHVVGRVVAVRHDGVQLEVGRCDLRFQSGVDDRCVVERVGRQET